MKIHRIHLRNLNSLRTDVTLDFDNGPLAYNGLFAITGDTGAGKTTMLDAITLALFGRTSRDHQREVMSNGATESFAEVEFSNENGRFLARWEQRKKRRSEQLDTNRFFSRWENGAYVGLYSGLQGMSAHIARHLGMGYDQFKRTVLLAQGEFAAFLHSDEKDRAAVLERLTNTEVYTRLSKAAHEKRKEEQEKLHKLEEKRDHLQLLSPEQLEEKAADLQKKETERDQISQLLSQLRNNQNWLERLHALRQKQAQLADDQRQLDQDELRFQADFERLRQHRQTLPLRPSVARFQALEKEHDELLAAGEQIGRASEAHQQVTSRLEQALGAAEQSLAAAHQALRDAEAVFEKVIQLDTKIGGESDGLESLRAQATHFLTETKQLEKQISEGKAAHKRVEDEIQALEAWLNTHRLIETFGENMQKAEAYVTRLQALIPQGEVQRQRYQEALQAAALSRAAHLQCIEIERIASAACDAAQIKCQQFLIEHKLPGTEVEAEATLDHKLGLAVQALQHAENFTRDYRDYCRAADEQRSAEARQSALVEQIRNLDADIRQLLDQEMPALDALCRTKRTRYELQQLTLQFADARAALLPGEPCPVCGSEHHPLATHVDAVALENDALNELERAEKSLLTAQKRQTALETQRESLQKNLHETEMRLQGPLRDELEKCLSQLRRCEPDAHQLEALLMVESGSQTTLLQQKTAQLSIEKERLEAVRTHFKQLTRALRQCREAQAQAATDLHSAHAQVQLHTSACNNLAQNLAAWQQAVDDETAVLNPLLAPFGIVFSAGKIFEDAFGELQRDARQFAENARLLGDLMRGKEAREIKLDAQERQLADRLQDAERLHKTLEIAEASLEALRTERASIFGDKKPQVERSALRERIDEWSTQLRSWQDQQKENIHRSAQLEESQRANRLRQEKNQSERHQLIADLEAALQKTGFANIEDLLHSILPSAEAETLEQYADALRTRRASLQQNRAETEEQIQQEAARVFAHQEMTPLLDAIKTSEAALQNAQQEIGALKTQMAEQARRSLESEALLQQIGLQQTELNRWEALRKLIGSSDGSTFRAFAQGLTLQQLVQRANLHLIHLQGGRYRLRKRAGKDLDLEIVDTFQADHARSVITLSGGESFLASLALALGLADMTGGQASRVQSLFIDEGFGSLDEQALEMAIATLESLQARGVTIGIISHVRELKERISTQVRVERTSEGFSTVNVVG